MDLNPEIDLSINTEDLTAELRLLSLTLYRYYCQKANAERSFDLAKANLKEIRASVYKMFKGDTTTKRTEAHIESEIDTSPAVLEAIKIMIEAQHEATTWVGAVDSMKAKKDLLVQLASDRRKEV